MAIDLALQERLMAAAPYGMGVAVHAEEAARADGRPVEVRRPHPRRAERQREPSGPASCGRTASAPTQASPCFAGTGPSSSTPSPPVRAAGARMTPINWHISPPEVAYIVANCEARVLIADAAFAPAVAAAQAESSHLRLTLAVGGGNRGRGVLGRGSGGGRRLGHRQPDPRLVDALHLGHDRPSQGRLPQGRRDTDAVPAGGPRVGRTSSRTRTAPWLPDRSTTPPPWA